MIVPTVEYALWLPCHGAGLFGVAVREHVWHPVDLGPGRVTVLSLRYSVFVCVRSYREGKSVMKSSGTSSCRGTGSLGWLGHTMCSLSTAASTQSSMLK